MVDPYHLLLSPIILTLFRANAYSLVLPHRPAGEKLLITYTPQLFFSNCIRYCLGLSFWCPIHVVKDIRPRFERHLFSDLSSIFRQFCQFFLFAAVTGGFMLCPPIAITKGHKVTSNNDITLRFSKACNLSHSMILQ